MSKLLSHNYSAYVLIDAMLVYNINLYYLAQHISSVGHTYACSKHIIGPTVVGLSFILCLKQQ